MNESDPVVTRAESTFTPLSVMFGTLVFTGTFVLCVIVSTWLGVFGWSVFLFCPLVATQLGLRVASKGGPVSVGQGCAFSLFATVATSGLLLLTGIEGAPCVVMAIVLVGPIAAISGIVFGILASSDPRHNQISTGSSDRPDSKLHALALLAALTVPSGATCLENMLIGSERSVSTEIIIDASPEEIWPNVIAFPEIDADGVGSDHWTFRLGYPQPVRCDLDGEGVGAMRYCVFEDDRIEEPVFDERITVWAPGEELSFSCADQPSRLDPYLTVTDGQFLFVDLGDGRTKIVGTTWYTLRCAPYGYFDWWCERILHGIHTRVLEHVKARSESEEPPAGASRAAGGAGR